MWRRRLRLGFIINKLPMRLLFECFALRKPTDAPGVALWRSFGVTRDIRLWFRAPVTPFLELFIVSSVCYMLDVSWWCHFVFVPIIRHCDLTLCPFLNIVGHPNNNPIQGHVMVRWVVCYLASNIYLPTMCVCPTPLYSEHKNWQHGYETKANVVRLSVALVMCRFR